MKIVILGAGRVGSTVAESLVSESNDITVVDQARSSLTPLQERLDLRTVIGSASHPNVMIQAGMEDADMMLALTGSDETNLVACKLAASLFNTPTRIARIRTTDYLDHPDIFSKENFCVDFAICPERILTQYIEKLIEFPGALQVLDFASGKVSLVAVKAVRGGPLIGRHLKELRQHVPNLETRVAAIFRHNHSIIPEGSTIVEEGDEVFFIASSRDIRAVMNELRRMDKPVRRVMIAGGGRIGRRLAEVLQQSHQVRIIERDIKVCESLTQSLHNVLILHGDVTDEELLESENISEMDIFCALTDSEENNIMAALMAKRKGARKVIALINRSIYVDLMQGSGIDIAISPAQVTIGSLLAYVRQGDVAVVHSLRRGAAEALELVAHGDASSSRIVGRKIEEIKLPRGTTIGAIVRGLPPRDVYHQKLSEIEENSVSDQWNQATVIITHHDTVIEQDDHVILFVVNKKMVRQVEKLFQVNVGFL
ncbi:MULTISPECIES: Trk system potassium transporter TrkA [Nitrosomonas]|uniref:Trk system potassium uptake protein TrkA n=2 Tax=Nitrosomonas eutropha TaxID=916 RepID=A0ABX5MBP3_9PROT|nr:Trk system potassium transporter TrkA [Nitrosomonas eutropha]MXS79429.1 Trk system potassium transporter TrkA [Nitrosomonas sp. GH22]ABI59387.1 TrkA-N domain protein [Nitrosomonas eutropha C91]PXV83268.1 trk system potassium uptake protein TrkA [Nitrosomonas eutropha]SCX09245.1 trk system potassium uptake protein TrkA [Nitrosomonas eutropha]SDV99308.1 trk system potassium uptake protein TrkA [Nitrosomonas eutropha]